MGNKDSKQAGRRTPLGPDSSSGRFANAIDDAKGGRKEQENKAAMLNRKAIAYLHTGMYHEAEQMFEESLKLRRMLNQDNTPEFILTSHNLAVARGKLGHTDAPAALRKTIESMKEMDLNRNTTYANALANEGRLLAQNKLFDEAVQPFEEAKRLYEELRETESVAYYDAMRDFADCLVHNKPDRAVELCKHLDAILKTEQNIPRGRVMVTWARAEIALNDTEAARLLLETAISLLSKHDPTQPTWLTRKTAGPFLENAERLLVSLPKPN